MASSGSGGSGNQTRENIKQLRAFQELFKGRFDEEEAACLLDVFDWDSMAASSFVFTTEPEDVRKRIDDEKSLWVKVEKKSPKLAEKVVYLQKSFSIIKEAKLGAFNTSARLFACGPCDHFWWRRTPQRKEVSKCHRCRVRYDPVPRDKEWGWGMFRCERCQNEFSGYCGMWQTSPCFKCGNTVQPYCIRPPDHNNRQRKTQNVHKCNAPDCKCNGPNATHGAGLAAGARGYHHHHHHHQSNTDAGSSGYSDGDLRNTDPGSEADYDYNAEDEQPVVLPMTCVHPSSRLSQHLRAVVWPSRPHDSTGSTVATFLSQGDLQQARENVLDTIEEDD